MADRIAGDPSAFQRALDPVEVLHLDAHTGHACVFTDPTCCPEYDDALDVLDVLDKAGFRLVRGPQPWCPECFEAPEPVGSWAPPGDRCADEHVLPWLLARQAASAEADAKGRSDRSSCDSNEADSAERVVPSRATGPVAAFHQHVREDSGEWYCYACDMAVVEQDCPILPVQHRATVYCQEAPDV